DSWLGYNFGIQKKITNRNRKFIALRFFDGYYEDQVDQETEREEKKYNNAFGYLSEFTLYRQDFYKTRYVLGFGRTEDVPSGFTIGATAGYVKTLDLERPYGALKWNYANANKKGNFYKFSLQTGGYLRTDEFEDVVVTAQAGYFTKLWQLNRYKMRNLVSTTYTQLFNQSIDDWLNINKLLIPGFKTESLEGDVRLSVHLESVVYTPWVLLGFRFSPFAAVDMVSMQCKSCDHGSDLYWGFSSGFRSRNENLIFGTMEVRITYIPYDENGDSKIVFGFKQNLRIKNTGSFVRAPSLINYNNYRVYNN
ncbi:MAG: hypothetical protein OEU76_00335, partial [Cyclobacteriaceae bacterium]|nr:hypothetical protein [Cyclobacteriaceae bacterium]